jgi:hypothetical protein
MFVGRGQVGVADEAQDQSASDYQGLIGSASVAATQQRNGNNAEPAGLNNLRIESQDEIDLAIQGESSPSRPIVFLVSV